MTTHTAVLIPGDGIGPEVSDAVLSVLEAREGAGEIRDSSRRPNRARLEAGRHLAREHAERHPSAPHRAQGAVHDAHWQGLQLGQRRLAPNVEPVCGSTADSQHAGGEDPVRERRPGDRAREHRGLVQRHRERDHRRRGGEHEGRDARCLSAHCALDVSLCDSQKTQENQRFSQSEHHEAERRHAAR